MSDRFEEYRRKVEGTNIDPRSLLSTDYFNTFNSVAMLLDMVPDMPELLEEIEQWQFYDYVGHFRISGLDFADLAIEAYEHSPRELRDSFERKINGMKVFIEGTRHMLRGLLEAGETRVFGDVARQMVIIFRRMADEGGAIVHGYDSTLNQDNIDKLF